MRYIQVLDALDFGDAVSNQVLNLHHMLLLRGEDTQIFTKHANYRVQQYRQPFEDLTVSEDVVLIHHFSGYSEIAGEVLNFRCYKILVYHNITPHTFFEKGSDLYNFCHKGRLQLQNILSRYNFAIGDSLYNCSELEDLGFKNCKELPIAIPVLRDIHVSPASIKHLRKRSDKIWLFVGRIAPNKRQDLILDVFACYAKLHPEERHHLYLVGRYEEDNVFYQKVLSKIKNLHLEEQVTLSGKVEDEMLPAYYRAADIFICMSQHEGFCVPIVEAFNYQIPVVAYASTAIETTLGDSYGALKELDVRLAVDRIHAIFSDPNLQEELKVHGLQQASRFNVESVQKQLYSILDEVIPSKDSSKPLIVSVVICTCNRHDYLERCLTYLDDQDYPYFEVVVVNGPSTDDTMSILNDRYNIKIAQNPKMNLSISRNLGIEQASGDIIAFIDDDALPYSNWLTEIVRRYQELPPNVVGIGGRTFFANKLMFQFEDGITDSFGDAICLMGDDPRINTPNRYRHLLGTNATFRRNALISVQGFDEQYDYYLDETDLAVRLQQAGGLLGTAPKAYVRHEFAQSHNRLGKYNFNWKVISKNMIYFGMKNAKQDASLPKRLYKTLKQVIRQRCLDFLNAAWTGKLTWGEALFYCGKAMSGVLVGYYDCCFQRKLRTLASEPAAPFLPYLSEQSMHPHQQASLDIVEEIQEEINDTLSSSTKLHILIVSQEFPPHSFGGIGAYSQTLAKELIQLGHDVTVISRGSHDSVEIVGPFTHIQVAIVKHEDALPESPVLSRNFAWARTVRKLAEAIHLQHPISVIESAIWDFETIDLLRHRHELKIPLVTRLVTPLKVAMEINGWKINADFKRCMEMEKILVDYSDAVVPISHSIQNSFQSIYGLTPDSRWSVQMLGVQPWPSYTSATSYGELPSDLKRREIQILFIGRLEARKGIDIFLKALKLLIGNDDRIGVWIAGRDIEGWRDRSTSILGQEICDRIQFFGMVAEEFRELLYANCDFVVFPSRYESFGLVALEAMVYQKPVIGAAAGAIPEVVIDGESGLLFEPDNEQDLAQKILLLTNDESLRKKLGQGAKQRVEVLSSRNMAKSSLLLYQSIVEKNAMVEKHRIDRQPPHHQIQCEVLDEFERIVTQTELQLGESLLETDQLNPLNLMKSSLEQSPLTNFRSDWDITRPRIIGWGFLNRIANRFIVPKIATFINSVLHPSMQMQSSLNRTLLSENFQLKNKINQMTEELSQLVEMKDQLAQLIESTKKLGALQESTNSIHNDGLQEMRNIMDNTRIQIILESEVIRSEFSYQSKIVAEPLILDSDKLSINSENLRLNLGCGMQIMEGYINIDERKLPGVDLVADIGKLPFAQESVAEIYAAHLVEHIIEFDLKRHVLPYWHDLLQVDGKLVIICPDAEHMIFEYAKKNFHWDALRKITYGAQDYGGNFHYNMFTAESLSNILLDCGFRDISCEKARFVNGFYEMQINARK